MTGKLGYQGLDTLEQRFETLRDRIGAMPEACRSELEGALLELSQAIAALRADREAGGTPQPDAPGGQGAQAGEGGKKYSPLDLEAWPGPCEAMLHHVFNAVPDLLTIHDRDFNTILSNWHGHEFVPEAERRGRPKCYRVYHHRDRPCDHCHALEVLATGRPVKVTKVNAVDGRVREVLSYPIRDESGRVVLVVEHVRDITERRLAEEALKESEGRFRTLIEDSPESLFLTDVQGTILAASRVAAQRLGKNLAEIIGVSAFDLFPPEVAARRRVMFEQAVATGLPVRLGDARGDRHFDIHFNPILDAEGKVSRLSVLGLDITERKNAEQALKESEARFRAIFATAQDSIFIKDRSFRYTLVNPALERLFGRPAAEIIGKTDLSLLGAADTERIRKQDRRVLNGEVVKGIHTVTVQDVPVTFHYIKAPLRDEAGEIVGICGIARDISDLKRVEAALSESEERFRMLFEYAPDAYILADMQGEIIDCNQAAEDLAGYGREELVGNNFACLPWLDFRQQVRLADLLAQTARGEVMGPVDFTLTHKDGGEVIAEGLSLPLYIQGQNLVMTIVRDITARKQAEAALKESEARFRHISSTISDISYSCTVWPDGSHVLDWLAGAAERITGYSAEQIKARRCWDFLVIEADQPRFEKYIAGLGTGASGTCELRLRHKNGGIVWVASFAKIVPIPEQPGVFSIYGGLVDISARKQAEEALAAHLEFLRLLLDTIPDPIFFKDPQGAYLGCNKAFEDFLGVTRQEIVGKSVYDLSPREQADEYHRMDLEAFQVAGPQVYESRVQAADGTRRHVVFHKATFPEPTGGVGGLVGIIMDITGLKQAEAELRESEQRFRLMAETIQDVFWIATRRIGKTVYVSPGFEYIWGRTREALYRNPKLFLETVHPEDRERVRTEIIAAREGSIPWDHEYRIIRPDGTARWIQNRGFPVRDDQGRVILFTGVATDITEHKALEGQLLQAQKMEAVGRLAGGVAHDFNNLLMAITGYGELMRAKVLRDDPLYGHLENILKAGDRAAALTQQLLTFSRQQVIQPQVIDLSRVVLDLESMLRRLIGEDLHLEVVTDRSPAVVKADPGQMGQIIMNLVVNARDAMPQGGRLTLKISAVDLTESCNSRFGPAPPGAYVILVAQDTGVGMDEDTQAHVFEPFFTTKEPGKGTGLGLSTVYGIVKQSGGYLDLESSPGAGSAFTIYLPRLEAVVEPSKAKIPITDSFQGDETILLVEDEDMLRGLLAKFLRLYGYTVLEARHGGEALLACERHPGPIHLMVTDVVMPQMSGRELADRLTPLRPDMKVLYMSGYTEDALVQHGVADLSVAFLQKPFRPIELARRVYAVLHLPVTL
jgi:PAS domain S-box-containing protein